jgi:hypothetical protein
MGSPSLLPLGLLTWLSKPEIKENRGKTNLSTIELTKTLKKPKIPMVYQRIPKKH